MWFDCPYLGVAVELTAERERHIANRHRPLVRVGLRERIGHTLADPDRVGRDIVDPTERAFIRTFDDGWVIVVVLASPRPAEGPPRHWVVTAYPSVTLEAWVIEWEKP